MKSSRFKREIGLSMYLDFHLLSHVKNRICIILCLGDSGGQAVEQGSIY